MARHRRDARRWRRAIISITIPVVLIGLLVGAWAADTRGDNSVRNVELAGQSIGDRSPAAVADRIAALDAEYQDAPVTIATPDGEYESTAGALGLAIDREATTEAVLEAGRTALAPLRPFRWVASFVAPHHIDPVFTVDRSALEQRIIELEGDDRVPPVEPTIETGAAGLQVRAGVPGSGIDIDEIAAELPAAAERTDPGDAIRLEVDTGPIPPTFTQAQAQAVADEANAITAAPLSITVAGVPDASTQVSQPTMQSWMRTVSTEGALTLALDQQAVVDSLVGLLPNLAQEPRNASFDVVAGQPVVIPSQDGTACCAADTADRLLEAMRTGAGTAEVALDITPAEFTTEQATALGIVEEVGQPDAFGPTTRHACCQPRVENIHRIADILRGYVIRPGDTLSVNDYVGPRTREKGFVSAPVIYDGEFRADVGGGVSQFATTLFNAALYAGLDFGEYQSHSIRISRYPLGHEATISHPHPDLEIVNNTPYGVLVWPTYTDSSVTVHLYSTRYADVALGEPTSRPQGNCTRMTTARTRTYPDGRVDEDSVFAVYRPGEGVNC